MGRYTASSAAGRGVFRRLSGVWWLRRRLVLPGYLQVAGQLGVAAAAGSTTATAQKRSAVVAAAATGAAGVATARKVVALGGACSSGAAAVGVARKSAPQAAAAVTGASTTGRATKRATPVAAGTAGATGTGAVVKRATPTGVCVAAASGKATSQAGAKCAAGPSSTAGPVTKRVALGGTCTAVTASRVTAQKRAVETGQAATGATGSGAASRRAPQAGAAAAGPTGVAVARKQAPRAGVSAAGASAQVAVRKTAQGVGASTGGATGAGGAAKKTPQAAAAAAGPGPRGVAGKRTAAQGVGGGGPTVWVVARKRAPLAGFGFAGTAAAARTSVIFNGRATAGATTAGAARKFAVVGGCCTAGVGPRGIAVARKLGQTGWVTAGVGVYAQAVKRTAQTGRTTAGPTTFGFIIIVGPTTGTRVSPPLAIPDGPIAGSRLVWDVQLNGGTLLVETSVDGGASWQTATNGAAVPRLVQGDDRPTRTVLTRVILSRAAAADPSPRLFRMELEVAVDSSVEELVPVGVFTLNDVEILDGPQGLSIELSGADLSRRVSRNRWDDTYVIDAGGNYATAIQELIRNRMPDAVFNFASTPRATPRLFFGEQSSNDPWEDAQKMAESIGYEVFFDARGICTLRPEPDPDVDDSVWEFNDTTHPTIIEVRRRVTDENTYNKVIVTGESSQNVAPVRAVAIDDDPASPTYYLGPYGTVTYRLTSPLILVYPQAEEAARALLLRVKGATEAVEMDVVPMPALEPGDVVTVNRSKSRIDGRFLIDQMSIPWGADESMRCVGRRQRL